jgi:hypothetical protein
MEENGRHESSFISCHEFHSDISQKRKRMHQETPTEEKEKPNSQKSREKQVNF